MRPEDVLALTPSGVCCKRGGFHIDPTRPVERALITHGHSDHARAGHGAVLATQETLDIMRLRYGENFAGRSQAIRYGETDRPFRRASELPSRRPRARLGANQNRDARACASSPPATTKTPPDPTCAAFEIVPCDVFITEATFGLPVFRHHDAEGEIDKLLRSVGLFPERAHLVGAYSLGKAQRVIAMLRAAGYDKPIYLHGAMERSRAITRTAASSSAGSSWCAAPRKPTSRARSPSVRRVR